MNQELPACEGWMNSVVVAALHIIASVAPGHATWLHHDLTVAHDDLIEIKQREAAELDKHDRSFFRILFGDRMAIGRKYRALTQMRWRVEYDTEQRILDAAIQITADEKTERNATVRY